MKESIHKYFQVGTIQWMSYPQRDPMESLKAICKDDFFDAIELKGYGDKNEEAKKLLTQSSLPINTVSLYVGYSNFSYFTKMFKDNTGYAPLEYRRSFGEQ